MHYMFFSYTRDDWDLDKEFLKPFMDDLAKLILGRENHLTAGVRLTKQNVIFRDAMSIEVGKPWPEELAEALRTCRVFAYLHTANFFESEYCAKEYGIFRDRVRQFRPQAGAQPPGAAAEPRLILPILWATPGDVAVPETLEDIQYTQEPFGDEYKRVGLKRLLMRGGRSNAEYKLFRDAFVDVLVQSARTWKLEPAASIPDIKAAVPAWKLPTAPTAPAVAAPSAGDWGPEHALFFYIDPNWGLDWFPFEPPKEDLVVKFAEAAAKSLGITCHHVILNGSLLDRIREAQERNTIVVIVANPATALNPAYHEVLAQCAQTIEFFNCAVLFAWNRRLFSDAKVDEIKKKIFAVFYTQLSRQIRNYYLDSIESRDLLLSKLQEAMKEAQGRIKANPLFVRPVDPAEGLKPPFAIAPTVSNKSPTVSNT